MKRFWVFGFSLLMVFFAFASASEVIVIAHRGASGYLPEHTLEAYALAYGLGADFIEPDLVLTQDGVLIALHDITLDSTTDVAEVFPDRAREDGKFYAIDFTLEEIKQLEVQERRGADGEPAFTNRFPQGWAAFEIPTHAELIELVQGLPRARETRSRCAAQCLPRDRWSAGRTCHPLVGPRQGRLPPMPTEAPIPS